MNGWSVAVASGKAGEGWRLILAAPAPPGTLPRTAPAFPRQRRAKISRAPRALNASSNASPSFGMGFRYFTDTMAIVGEHLLDKVRLGGLKLLGPTCWTRTAMCHHGSLPATWQEAQRAPIATAAAMVV